MNSSLIRKVTHYLTTPVTVASQDSRRRDPGWVGTAGTAPIGAAERSALPERNPYVCSEVLEHFQHAFDAEELWRSARTKAGQRGGLRAVISSHPHLGDRRLPTSIVLEFPEELVEHDNRIGGNSTATLLAGLTELYLKDLKDRLKSGEVPRFAAATSTDLSPKQIRVRMGAAIFVPGNGDPPAWRIHSSLDGAIWHEACSYQVPSGQRLWILGGSRDYASVVCEDWPFSSELGVAMVARPDTPDLQLSSQPLKGLKIAFNRDLQCYVVTRPPMPKGAAVECTVDLAGRTVDAEQVLYLRTERLLPVVLAPLPSREELQVDRASAIAPAPLHSTEFRPAHDQSEALLKRTGTTGANRELSAVPRSAGDRALASELDAAPTFMAQPPDATLLHSGGLDESQTLLAQPPAGVMALLSLEGVALQRPSNFLAHGVKGLQFGISAQGSVVAADSALRVLRVDVSNRDEVRVTTLVGTRLLAPGEALPLDKGRHLLQLRQLPAELASHYIGWMRLPLGQPITLRQGEIMSVGRQLEALRPLQPLAGTGFLTQVPTLSGDQMGMSRRHFELRVEHGDDTAQLQLDVQPLGSNTVVELDSQMAYVGTATADRPRKLVPGHCLVVGHYVWRFGESCEVPVELRLPEG